MGPPVSILGLTLTQALFYATLWEQARVIRLNGQQARNQQASAILEEFSPHTDHKRVHDALAMWRLKAVQSDGVLDGESDSGSSIFDAQSQMDQHFIEVEENVDDPQVASPLEQGALESKTSEENVAFGGSNHDMGPGEPALSKVGPIRRALKRCCPVSAEPSPLSAADIEEMKKIMRTQKGEAMRKKPSFG
jgi:hypothetical protein